MITTVAPSHSHPPGREEEVGQGERDKGTLKSNPTPAPPPCAYISHWPSLSAKKTGKQYFIWTSCCHHCYYIESERPGSKCQLCHLPANVVKLFYFSKPYSPLPYNAHTNTNPACYVVSLSVKVATDEGLHLNMGFMILQSQSHTYEVFSSGGSGPFFILNHEIQRVPDLNMNWFGVTPTHLLPKTDLNQHESVDNLCFYHLEGISICFAK